MAKKQHKQRRVPGWILWAIPAAGAALAVCLWLLSSPFPRVEVSGFRITEEEYRRAMYQARNDVLSDHAAAGISLTDWHAETPLGDPCRLITERTLEILTEYYAVSTLAVERGYLADAGYDAMRADLETVNRQRQEALDAGEVITGTPHFTTDDYLTYRAASIRLRFFADGNNPENQVTDEEIALRYEEDRDSLYLQPDSLELAFLVIDTTPADAGALEKALKDLEQAAREEGSIAAALEKFPLLQSYYQEISVNPENYAVYDRSHSDVLAWAAGLETGEISGIFRQDNRLCLIQCLERTVHRYIPLEDVRSVVAQSILESRYDTLIAARMENTEITGDLQALYRFTAAQFPSLP